MPSSKCYTKEQVRAIVSADADNELDRLMLHAEDCEPCLRLLQEAQGSWICPSCGAVWPSEDFRDGYGCDSPSCEH